jgi:SAM-dependent methyltransferase
MVLEWEKYPLFRYPLPKKAKAEILSSPRETVHPLRIAHCSDCTHLFQVETPPMEFIEEIYNKYYFYPSPLETGIAVSGADIFIEKLLPHLPTGAKVLEIGCFDGYVLSHLKRRGHKVTGCDPSRGADIGKRFGIDIKKAYFDGKLFPPGSFDLVIFRHLIEHVPDPGAFLQDVRNALRDGGMIALETPDCGFHVASGSFLPFHHEHLSNFTVASLRHLLERNGFEITYMESTPDNIRAFARKKGMPATEPKPTGNGNSAQWAEFNRKFRKKNEDVLALAKKISGDGGKLAVWGAGGFTAVLLTNSGAAPYVEFIVDSDSRKWGCEYLDFDVPIVPPERISSDRPGYVLIGSQFADEIIRNMRARYGQGTKLIRVHPQLEIL